MSLGMGITAACVAALLHGPTPVPWIDALVSCARRPAERPAMEHGRLTTSYECGLPQWLRVAHRGGGWAWSPVGPLGTYGPLGFGELVHIRSVSAGTLITRWFSVPSGALAGHYVRVWIQNNATVEVSIMSPSWVRANVYDMRVSP